MAGSQKDKEPVNIVAQQAILVETILKEERYQKLFTNYSINPFKKMHTLTGKPNSFHDTAEGEEDSNFRSVIARANEVPTKKYLTPQTESQEYGWMTQPLIEFDRHDDRLHRPTRHCEITKYMDVVWALERSKTAN